jgi:peptidoglycan-N-acetylglucosamine deacetylase
MFRVLLILLCCATSTVARADSCPGNPDALGMPLSAAKPEIGWGIIAVNSVVYGRADARPVAPFFRFPGFASALALGDRLNSRGIVTFNADLWASDWNPMTPEQELQPAMMWLRAEGGGTVLLHDTRSETAAMPPALLKELKNRGYRVVHVAAAGVLPAPHPSCATGNPLSLLWKSTATNGKAQ